MSSWSNKSIDCRSDSAADSDSPTKEEEAEEAEEDAEPASGSLPAKTSHGDAGVDGRIRDIIGVEVRVKEVSSIEFPEEIGDRRSPSESETSVLML
jgi:hypothetical protein